MDQTISEIGNIDELSSELTTGDVAKLRILMNVPVGICDEDCDGTTFLFAILNWESFNPNSFYQALTSLNRPYLVEIAIKIPRLCVSKPLQGTELFEETLSMKTLLQLLRNEISQKKWQIIAMGNKGSLQRKYDFEIILKDCLESQLINKELNNFERALMAIKCIDVATKIREYKSLFVGMSEDEFIGKMKRTLKLQSDEIKQWEHKLKQFLNKEYTMVTHMLGEDDKVSLTNVYVELTIVKEAPRPVKFEDETTFNEIAYLRKIAKKEIEITPVDFANELKTYTTENPEIWCLIGNPGCGKTFLSKRIALRFADAELKQISYSIAIPCRSTNWHSMETTRLEEDKSVTSEFVQEWLCLGLPATSDWTKDLAKHIAKSDGEGLLLIIDGLDEFTKKIPFDKSLLYSLLTRETLNQSTIIATTRPGAWTDIRSHRGIQVNRFYQVLGFSPENRDKYFEMQITKLNKLKECKKLLSLYDEMNQLSLIPVNASLFAALLKDDTVTIQTLTHLYRELTCYLIRRQLDRMTLKEQAKVKKIELFNESVLDCLYAIGRIAMIGVGSRELTSTERVSMTIDYIEVECHCLGLAHEFYTKDSAGSVKKVWAFAHLTMQEFTSAIFLKSTSWTDQCLSVRYIADSNEHFSVFRMVVRFLCGLLANQSAALLTILCRKLFPDTTEDIPMYYQLESDIGNLLLPYTGWYDFTKKYFQLIPNLFETNSLHIHLAIKRFLPTSVSLYLNEKVLPVSPNEWTCFTQSLQLVKHITLLYIHTSHVSIEQFESIMKQIQTYPLSQLAVIFEGPFRPMSPKVLAYTNLINKAELSHNTRISIELKRCEIKDLTDIDLFTSPINQHINSLKLYDRRCFNELLHQLANCVVSSEYFQYLSISEIEHFSIILPALIQATQLKGLYMKDCYLSRDDKQLLQELMPKLTQLTEIKYPDYSLLPHMAHLTGLTYLDCNNGYDKSLSANLLRVLNNNHNTLRVVTLLSLEIGFKSWTELLSALQCCVNIVKLEISHTRISSEDISQWTHTLRCLQSLIYLKFELVTLSDAGMLAVCLGLAKHTSIRYLQVSYCEQTSQSCEALTNLIPTLRQLETLRIDRLSEPDPVPIKALRLAAEEYSIKLYY